jgi:hypothetical protein
MILLNGYLLYIRVALSTRCSSLKMVSLKTHHYTFIKALVQAGSVRALSLQEAWEKAGLVVSRWRVSEGAEASLP